MPIRQLDSYLQQENLVAKYPLEAIRHARLGIDAGHWLRKLLSRSREPLVPAMGGAPLTLRLLIEAEIVGLRKYNIIPIVVFNGLNLMRKEKPFSVEDTRPAKRNSAWDAYYSGRKDIAMSLWSSSGSTSFADYILECMSILRDLKVEFIRAPFASWAQLSWMLGGHGEELLVDAVYAGTELFLFNAPTAIVNIDIEKMEYDCITRDVVLAQCQLSFDQFVDLAILAGFDYCPTFPPFAETGVHFSLRNVIGALAKFQNGLNVVMQHAEHPLVVQTNYMESFVRTRCAILNHVILDDECCIVPLNAHQCPGDLQEIFGWRLPNTIYFYSSMAGISPQVLNGLLSGSIIEAPPLCNGDTVEYRSLLKSLVPMRTQIISLLTHHLNESFKKKKVSTHYWFEAGLPIEHIMLHSNQSVYPAAVMVSGLPINFISHVKSELGMQTLDSFMNTAIVFKILATKNLMALLTARSSTDIAPKLESLSTVDEIVFLNITRLLKLRGYLSNGGLLSNWGNALLLLTQNSSRNQEECLIALELLRSGYLNGQPVHTVSTSEAHVTADEDSNNADLCGVRLIARVISLTQANCQPTAWTGPVDRELLRFHSLVRTLSRTFRSMTEMMILADFIDKKSELANRVDIADVSFRMPYIIERSTAMGMLAKSWILNRLKSNRKSSIDEWVILSKEYPQILNVQEDVKNGLQFFDMLFEAVKYLNDKNELEASLWNDFDAASKLLKTIRTV